jgi:hypothetical protein
VDDRVRAQRADQLDELVRVTRDVEVVEGDAAARVLLPGRQARAQRADRRQRGGLELDVGGPAGEVVDDRDVVAAGRQVQRGGPSAEAVSSENQDAQGSLRSSAADPCRLLVDASGLFCPCRASAIPLCATR